MFGRFASAAPDDGLPTAAISTRGNRRSCFMVRIVLSVGFDGLRIAAGVQASAGELIYLWQPVSP